MYYNFYLLLLLYCFIYFFFFLQRVIKQLRNIVEHGESHQ